MTLDDIASDTEELFRQQALAHRKPQLPKTGFCFNCSEAVPQHANFCDCDCLKDYERRTENAKGR